MWNAIGFALIAACGGCASSKVHAAPSAVPDVAATRILILGNSHTSAPLPNYLAAFVGQATGQKVDIEARFGSFLESLDKPDVHRLIASGSYDFVVLQAQKYSTTGRYTYSTEHAEALAKTAIASKAVVVMYPEFPRRGVPEETQRIYNLHRSIAKRTGASVAPVGQAWLAAIENVSPALLYQADGNHAKPAGAFLTASVLAKTMYPKHDFKPLQGDGLPGEREQLAMIQWAKEAIAANPPYVQESK